jgi:hypothetical protein
MAVPTVFNQLFMLLVHLGAAAAAGLPHYVGSAAAAAAAATDCWEMRPWSQTHRSLTYRNDNLLKKR